MKKVLTKISSKAEVSGLETEQVQDDKGNSSLEEMQDLAGNEEAAAKFLKEI